MGGYTEHTDVGMQKGARLEAEAQDLRAEPPPPSPPCSQLQPAASPRASQKKNQQYSSPALKSAFNGKEEEGEKKPDNPKTLRWKCEGI